MNAERRAQIIAYNKTVKSYKEALKTLGVDFSDTTQTLEEKVKKIKAKIAK